MISPEKVLEMFDPSKTFAPLTQGKIFDVDAQSKLVESYTSQVFKLMGLYQAQTRKALEFGLGQSEAAVKEGQKIANEWVATLTHANAELVKHAQDNVKEAAKAFELPKPAKVAKAA